MLYYWIQLLNLHTEKKKKYKLKNEFLADFYFILFFIFLFFSKFFFYFLEIWKSYSRFWRIVAIPIQKYQQIWASSTNDGPGGRQAPRLPSVIKKMWVTVGHITRVQIV